jgi:ubiquinone/menaquinone biosynthesis C-methylase UbiE
MGGRQVQVDASWYGSSYMTLPRAVTHWNQAREVTESCPPGGTVLEVGPGSGHVTWLLRDWGRRVLTVDLDPTVCPELVCDVVRLPLADASVDCVLAAEVLEHLPFDELDDALRELRRVTRDKVVVTLPAPFVGASILVNLTKLRPRTLRLGVPFMRRHRFDGQHYWELGKRGTSVRRVSERIRAAGFDVLRAYRPPASLYSYVFVLGKATTT